MRDEWNGRLRSITRKRKYFHCSNLNSRGITLVSYDSAQINGPRNRLDVGAHKSRGVKKHIARDPGFKSMFPIKPRTTEARVISFTFITNI